MLNGGYGLPALVEHILRLRAHGEKLQPVGQSQSILVSRGGILGIGLGLLRE